MSCIRDETSALVRKDCATWPANERATWLAHFDPAAPDRLTRWAMKGELPWVRETQYNCASIYSRYLACMRAHGLPDAVTREGVRKFITEAEGRGVVARTVAGYIKGLHSMMHVLYPEKDAEFRWLMDTYWRIHAVAKRQPKKKSINKRRYTSQDLYRLGAQLVLAGFERSEVDWASAKLVRDGLWLLLGATNPERCRALEAIKLSDLDLSAEGIKFSAASRKPKTEASRRITEVIRGVLDVWLKVYRAHFSPDHDHLWIVRDGGPARWGTMTAAMRSVTKKHLGIAVSPHRFRDAAATYIVENMPEQANLASKILGHKNSNTTAEYTETATQLTASRLAAEHLAAAEDEIARKIRRESRRNSLGRIRRRKKHARS